MMKPKISCLTHAFEVWNVVRIGFKVDERNRWSQRALEKIGAQQEEFIRKHMIRPDGSNRNSFLYGLTDDDWFSSTKHTLQNHVFEALIKYQKHLKVPEEVEFASVFL